MPRSSSPSQDFGGKAGERDPYRSGVLTLEWTPAVDAGITEAELVEFLNVAMTMQGCPGEEWALKAFQAYREVVEGRVIEPGGSCCH